jgi:hypothetical protein
MNIETNNNCNAKNNYYLETCKKCLTAIGQCDMEYLVAPQQQLFDNPVIY